MAYKLSKIDRRALGLCKDCPNAALSGRSLCELHMENAKQRRKDNDLAKKNAGLCTKCINTPASPGKTLCNMHLEKYRNAVLRRNRQLKIDVLNAYGGCKCNCNKCNCTLVSMLTIDHIDGGGNQHRREIDIKGGTAFYLWLKRNGYPPGFQVLCWNCNLSRRTSGICEHINS
jgi:hypothetical protein